MNEVRTAVVKALLRITENHLKNEEYLEARATLGAAREIIDE